MALFCVQPSEQGSASNQDKQTGQWGIMPCPQGIGFHPLGVGHIKNTCGQPGQTRLRQQLGQDIKQRQGWNGQHSPPAIPAAAQQPPLLASQHPLQSAPCHHHLRCPRYWIGILQSCLILLMGSCLPVGREYMCSWYTVRLHGFVFVAIIWTFAVGSLDRIHLQFS